MQAGIFLCHYLDFVFSFLHDLSLRHLCALHLYPLPFVPFLLRYPFVLNGTYSRFAYPSRFSVRKYLRKLRPVSHRWLLEVADRRLYPLTPNLLMSPPCPSIAYHLFRGVAGIREHYREFLVRLRRHRSDRFFLFLHLPETQLPVLPELGLAFYQEYQVSLHQYLLPPSTTFQLF